MAKRSKKLWSNTSIILNGSLLVGSSVGAAYELRQNNLHMLKLRQEVLDADTKLGDVKTPLVRLQSFVTTHMNTELPQLGSQPAIQLKATYEHLVQLERDRVSSERQRITSEATAYCEENIHGYLSTRAACVADYTATRQVIEAQVQSDLYKYNFASPSWSPDAAGGLIVVAVVLAVTFVLQCASRLLARFWMTM